VGTRRGERRGKDAGDRPATVARIETRIGVEAFLDHLRVLLKSGEFQPVEVRQVMIAKASGKLRKLGIPTVADRVVQASLKAVLEPIFEADLMPCSYGFRPNRRAHDAIAEIHRVPQHDPRPRRHRRRHVRAVDEGPQLGPPIRRQLHLPANTNTQLCKPIRITQD
jgi:retron-type reverse transcriptase